MRDFLAEFWPWIVIPFVLMVGGMVVLYFWAGGGDTTSPFTYDVLGSGGAPR